MIFIVGTYLYCESVQKTTFITLVTLILQRVVLAYNIYNYVCRSVTITKVMECSVKLMVSGRSLRRMFSGKRRVNTYNSK